MTDPKQRLRRLSAEAPEFTSLLAGAFNLDWDLDQEWPNAESVLVAGYDNGRSETNARLRDELEVLLRALQTNEEVDEFFFYVFTGLAPEHDFGMSAREWMIVLRERVARNCERIPAELASLAERAPLMSSVIGAAFSPGWHEDRTADDAPILAFEDHGAAFRAQAVAEIEALLAELPTDFLVMRWIRSLTDEIDPVRDFGGAPHAWLEHARIVLATA